MLQPLDALAADSAAWLREEAVGRVRDIHLVVLVEDSQAREKDRVGDRISRLGHFFRLMRRLRVWRLLHPLLRERRRCWRRCTTERVCLVFIDIDLSDKFVLLLSSIILGSFEPQDCY
jgi:hypothetical protein